MLQPLRSFLSRSANGQYEPLDIEDPPLHQQTRLSWTKTRKRPIILGILAIFFILLVAFFNHSPEPPSSVFTSEDINFDLPRPKYLDSSFQNPVIIRLAIISRVDEFERRQVFRDSMLEGVSKKHVDLTYKFFVGKPTADEGTNQSILDKITKENNAYDDVIVLKDTKDIPERLSEKRFSALKWSASVPHDQYDWFMTIDSDTFCRFRLLAQRLKYVYPIARPREKPAMVGRMGSHLVYFENTVPDDTEDDKAEDHLVKGRWYPYPLGIGYMLSSNLTATILSADPAVPHHIKYPSDDVMIGSWIAGLKDFHDPSIKFETSPEHDDPPVRPVHPKPYLPYSVDTLVIDDRVGWHDFKNLGRWEKALGWESACVHRMSAVQMKAFRKMEEVRDEWETY